MKWRCLYGKTEKMQKSLHGTGLFKFCAGRHPCGGRVTLAVEEYEVIRLIDLEKLTHEQCAKQMDISRTTVTEIYESAREKIADCIVNGRPMEISGGSYRLCDGSAVHFCRKKCRRGTGAFPESADTREPGTAPSAAGHSRERGTCNEDRSNI